MFNKIQLTVFTLFMFVFYFLLWLLSRSIAIYAISFNPKFSLSLSAARSFVARSRVLARLASLAQIGDILTLELSARLHFVEYAAVHLQRLD